MFNSGFYPTPKTVISNMIGNDIRRLRGANILEPSAGKGDICDYIKSLSNNGYYKESVIDCIEIEPELQAILRDKGFPVIDNDFLKFTPTKLYDYIIMNPPFDTGAKHLLKALEIAEGAGIVCLLNRESIDNPCTKERELLLKKLEDSNATIEYIGQAFRTAERTTNAEIALIRVPAVAGTCPKFQFTPPNREQEHACTIDDINNEQLARADVITSIVDRYNATIGAFGEIIAGMSKLIYYSDGLLGDYTKAMDMIKDCYNSDQKRYYNNIVDKFRNSCWNSVLSQSKFRSMITQRVLKDFETMQREQERVEFTIENIVALFDSLIQNKEEIMKQCVIDAFDLMTTYYEGNRAHIEGWKTNDRWQVNRKVILPWNSDPYLSRLISHQGLTKLIDIDKAMCFIAGQKYEDIESESINGVLGKLTIECAGEKYQTKFFEVRAFKKGTVHLYFRDEYYWIQFNKIATAGKNWLKSA